jgi:hypothetical protein
MFYLKLTPHRKLLGNIDGFDCIDVTSLHWPTTICAYVPQKRRRCRPNADG